VLESILGATVPGDALLGWLLSRNVGADVDGLACSLHRPMVYMRQRGGQSFLTGATPSCHAVVSGAVFPGDVKAPGLDILHGEARLYRGHDFTMSELSW
jgi:hypothetical protein